MTNDLTRDDLVKRLRAIEIVARPGAHIPDEVRAWLRKNFDLREEAARALESLEADLARRDEDVLAVRMADADRRVEEEREACAQTVERYSQLGTWTAAETRPAIASAIRARSNDAQPNAQGRDNGELRQGPGPVTEDQHASVNAPVPPIGCADKVEAALQKLYDFTLGEQKQFWGERKFDLHESRRQRCIGISDAMNEVAKVMRAQRKASEASVQTGAAGSVPESLAIGALREIAFGNYSAPDIDSAAAETYARIVDRMQEIAREALSVSPSPPVQERQEVGGGEDDYELAKAIVRAKDIFAAAPWLEDGPSEIPGCMHLTFGDLFLLLEFARDRFNREDPELHREPQPVGGGK